MLPPVRLLAMMGGLPEPVNIDPMPIHGSEVRLTPQPKYEPFSFL
jgi:hypothetical protein